MIFALLFMLDESEKSCVETIFEKYSRLIYKIAFDVLHNYHDSEEVLSEVMISVMKNIDKFLNVNENETVSQIVIYSRNSAINLYNKNKRRSKHEQTLSKNSEGDTEEFDIVDNAFDLEGIVIRNADRETVEKSLKCLSAEYRDVINLVYNFGYSNVEVAKILHITPNAVGLRLLKAKKKLLKMMGGEVDEYR